MKTLAIALIVANELRGLLVVALVVLGWGR